MGLDIILEFNNEEGTVKPFLLEANAFPSLHSDHEIYLTNGTTIK